MCSRVPLCVPVCRLSRHTSHSSTALGAAAVHDPSHMGAHGSRHGALLKPLARTSLPSPKPAHRSPDAIATNNACLHASDIYRSQRDCCPPVAALAIAPNIYQSALASILLPALESVYACSFHLGLVCLRSLALSVPVLVLPHPFVTMQRCSACPYHRVRFGRTRALHAAPD